MSERIQKLISSAGIASRRAAEALIKAGRVHINGTPAILGQRADLGVDTITVDGKPLRAPTDKVYIMLNKPRGYVTTMSDERGRPTVADLVSDLGVRVYPVGRLDMDSEGLLIMTNDGEAANRLMHPSHGVEKTYLVRVAGRDIGQGIVKLRGEIVIDGLPVRAKKVDLVAISDSSAELTITIGEGKNRQVRKMCALAGLEVRELKRISEGKLILGDLPRGKWRLLSQNEIEYLQQGLL